MRILIADNEYKICVLYEKWLKGRYPDAVIEFAASHDEVVKNARQFGPTHAILDIMMEGYKDWLDSFQTLKKKVKPTPYVIVITAICDPLGPADPTQDPLPDPKVFEKLADKACRKAEIDGAEKLIKLFEGLKSPPKELDRRMG